jgi:hypothetical protein
MKHTPYGYEIRNGTVVVNEEQVAVIRRVCENYLSGMTLIKAAQKEGLEMNHVSVKRLMQNERYLGMDGYPQILDEEIYRKVGEELKRRSKTLGRQKMPKKPLPEAKICRSFSAPKIPKQYDDAIAQAEYAYSLIVCKEGD